MLTLCIFFNSTWLEHIQQLDAQPWGDNDGSGGLMSPRLDSLISAGAQLDSLTDMGLGRFS